MTYGFYVRGTHGGYVELDNTQWADTVSGDSSLYDEETCEYMLPHKAFDLLVGQIDRAISVEHFYEWTRRAYRGNDIEDYVNGKGEL